MDTEILDEARAALEADRHKREADAVAEYNAFVADLQRRKNVVIKPIPFLLPDGRLDAVVQIFGNLSVS